MKKLSNLGWLDLEMTGLDPSKDVILEIASIVTDKDLNILAQGPSFVIHQSEEKLDNMLEVVKIMHTSSGLLEEVKNSKISITLAQEETKKFFSEFCFIGVSPLCGNSIWQDRRFLRKYMPELNSFFNYRNVDVSSVKELIKRWYAGNPLVDFEKKGLHRALPDVYASIAELAHYKKNFFVPEN